jgi:hypothetical protein
MAFDPITGGLQLLGAGAGIIGGSGAAAKQKQLAGLQYNYGRRQLQAYDQYRPEYDQAMQHYANLIGASNSEGLGGYVPQVGVSPHQAQRLGIDPNTQFQNPNMGTQNGYNLGVFGNQRYNLLRQGAEQQLQRGMQGADQNLLFQLGQQGIATGSQAAALAREHQGMLTDYAQYLRNLAIGAGGQEEANQRQYLAMLQGAMAPGAEGAGILGQQANMYGNQAAQGFGQAGQIAQNYIQNQAMQNALQAMYGGGGAVGTAPGETPVGAGYNYGGTQPYGAGPPINPQLAAFYQYLQQNETPAYGFG